MINSRDIKDLHPTLQRGCNELLRRCKELNLPILITQTYRDNEYQDLLFNKRPKITNARGGQSMHNYRLAFDFCKNVKGQEFSDRNFFNQAGKIWTDMGGEWGGNWKSFPDAPHCQFTNGYKDSDIFNKKYVMPIDTKMKWELNSVMVKPITTNKEKYMLRDIKILVNGKEITVPAILHQDQNYIKIQDLNKIDDNFSTGWDNEKRMPIINKK